MQPVSTAYKNTINRSHTLVVKPFVTVEWNYNEYQGLTVSNDAVVSEYDEVRYPISSITLPRRPTSGLPKTRTTGGEYAADSADIRYKVVSDEMGYKYWLSRNASTDDAPYPVPGVRPMVVYDKAVYANKLIVTFEVSWSRPDDVDVYITTDGTNWTQVGAGLVPHASSGRIILYRQSGGTWTSTPETNHPLDIMGVKVHVNSMNMARQNVGVIELGARLIQDISNDVSEAGFSGDVEEQNISLPIGDAIARECSIDLDNSTGKYDVANKDSPYFGLLDENAMFTLYSYLDATAHGGSAIEVVKHGEFYSDTWGLDTDSLLVSVNCTDYSKFLQEVMTPTQMHKMRLGKYVFRNILESVGIKDVVLNTTTEDNEYEIPYVWFKNDMTVWEALRSIAKAEQAVFFFDENGTLQYYSKSYIRRTRATDWTLRATKTGINLPNLINLSTQFEVQANRATVKYTPIVAKHTKKGVLHAALWSPDESTVLQSAPLSRTMSDDDTKLFLDADLSFWENDGFVEIEGEIMSYEKEGAYLNIIERGLYGTQAREHNIVLDGWRAYRFTGAGAATENPDRSDWGINDGALAILGRVSDYQRYQVVIRGNSNTQNTVYGAGLRYPKFKGTEGIAGMVVHMQPDNKAGYYFEVCRTDYIERRGGTAGEVRAYRMDADGTKRGLPNTPEGLNGAHKPVPIDVVHAIDITYDPMSRNFNLFINGFLYTSFIDDYGSPYEDGQWGMFVRGNTLAQFEYAYTTNPDETPDMRTFQFYDRLEGGYASAYPSRSNRRGVEKDWTFYEFVPVAHEAKEYDVEYNIYPALSAFVLLTTDRAYVKYHRHNAFGSKMMVVSGSRQQVVLHGDDHESIPDKVLRQTFMVYGQPLIRQDERTIVKQDDDSITRRGLVEVEIVSPWLQQRSQAAEIARYIPSHWAKPIDIIQVECIWNPALQLGDTVAISHPEKGMEPETHKYHVLGMSVTYGTEVSCSLTLRRQRGD